ncbi:MAG TPA: DUF748 domain-containing protein [Candidatus Binataceae bacterium]|nr:DUF748 domain-containing protein [Candidatus Binataceae bacterium]
MLIAALALGAFIAVVYGLSFTTNPLIRSRIERTMNSKLKDYHVQIRWAHLQLIGGNLTLTDLIIRQNAHPEPPIARIPKLVAHVEWKQILHGRMVADFLLSRPQFHVNLIQLRAEESSKRPVSQEGWQQAVESIYPFKINRFQIFDGDLTYIDVDPKRPLRLSDIDIAAGNIRNIEAPDKTYPSTLSADMVVFNRGRLTIKGNANFLARPFAGVWARYWIKDLPLDHFDPVIQRANLNVAGGVLDSEGAFQYAPWIEQAEVYDAAIKGIKLDYFHRAQPAPALKHGAQKIKRTAQEANNKPGLKLRVDKATIEKSEFTYTDETANPRYRLFMTDFSIVTTNFSNHFYDGPARIDMRGKFMGSGETKFKGTFRPENEGPDFSVNLAIENTSLPSLNDLLRAYGKLEVAQGEFSLFSQATVKEGQVHGYVKPIFSHLKVYSAKQQANKPFFHKAYEAVAGAVADLLKNPKTKNVATVANISGPLNQPDVSTWQALGEILRNAFIKAILPGFDRQSGAVNKAAGG